MKYLFGLLVVAALIYGGKLYFKKPAGIKPAETVINDEAAIQVINLTGQNFRFNPDKIQVKQGAKVKVILTAMDMPHDFNLDELNVNGPVAQPGETLTVEFTAGQKGEFEYYCSVGQHRAMGMVGTLVVE